MRGYLVVCVGECVRVDVGAVDVVCEQWQLDPLHVQTSTIAQTHPQRLRTGICAGKQTCAHSHTLTLTHTLTIYARLR